MNVRTTTPGALGDDWVRRRLEGPTIVPPERKTLRRITTHQNGSSLNEAWGLFADDETRGAGGAPRAYVMRTALYCSPSAQCQLAFQEGDPREGVNGLSAELLLAVVLDRLERFQEGPFACADNEEAATAVRQALGVLGRRSRERASRGVEGQAVE